MSTPTPTPTPTPPLNSVDAILSYYSKTLKPGETISIPLYKGKPTTTSHDFFLMKNAQKLLSAAAATSAPGDTHNGNGTSANGTGAGNGAAVPIPAMIRNLTQPFPKLAKFTETTEKPEFLKNDELKTGRLYQEDIPKFRDDSEDEDDDEPTSLRSKKKKRRQRPPKQHWVLQNDADFFKHLNIKLKKGKNPELASQLDQSEHNLLNSLSNRYEGLPESNNSSYVMMEAMDGRGSGETSATGTGATNGPSPSISITTLHGFINFTQPAKFKTLNAQDAEIATQKMIQNTNLHSSNTNNINNPASAAAHLNGSDIHQQTNTKNRLLRKLGTTAMANKNDDDDADNIMKDFKFREQNVSSALKTRQELLNDIGNDDIKIDYDGTLGGANDSEFAGGRRFGRMNAMNKNDNETDQTSGGGAEDDFYQQDVGDKFDNVDCDLDGLFDNNDEFMGAGETEDYDGFADVEDDDSDEEEDELELGAGGFASKTGMKALIAKAKGDTTDAVPGVTPPVVALDNSNNKRPAGMSSGSDRSDDEKDMSLSPPKKKPRSTPTKDSGGANAMSPDMLDSSGTDLVDEYGLRIITLESVRREIWIRKCSIKVDVLCKIFQVTGSSKGLSKAEKTKRKERKSRFNNICFELCTMEGNLLTLKQHYAKK